jgi:hypothetical protein
MRWRAREGQPDHEGLKVIFCSDWGLANTGDAGACRGCSRVLAATVTASPQENPSDSFTATVCNPPPSSPTERDANHYLGPGQLASCVPQ